MDSKQADQLLTITSERGWKAALGEVFPELQKYLDRQPLFLDLLSLDGCDVLEIGPGFGQFTEQIARRASTLEALEVDRAQARFLAERLKQQNVTNAIVKAGGEDCKLPYATQSFDVVVLNLVLEWCAIRLQCPHEEGQKLLLNEIARVLRPGGKLFLCTKNRFALRYLIGKPDEHFSGMRFGSALPRSMAALLFKGRPPGHLYSWGGLKRLLETSGFKVDQSWWAAPEMRYPEEMVPVGQEKTARRRGVREGEFRSERILMRFIPSFLIRHFAPGLTFLVSKADGEGLTFD